MLKLRYAVLWLVTVIVLLGANGLIVQKEMLLAQGETIYLELAPADPRSLIQGDYMRLRYAMVNEVGYNDTHSRRGLLVIRIDEQKVAHFSRFHQPDEALGADERLLNYHVRNDDVWIGAESFFFQEGQAEVYDEAKYAELRLSESGETLLVDLRGSNLEQLGMGIN